MVGRISGGAIAGISVAAVVVLDLLAICQYFIFRGKKEEDSYPYLEPYKIVLMSCCLDSLKDWPRWFCICFLWRVKRQAFQSELLIEAEGGSLHTRLVGTFGYMAPEYCQFGDVSPKIDVYAFGVVLYELISAEQAITSAEIATDSKGLVSLFKNAFNEVDPKEWISKLVDPKLGDDYPLDAVWNVALLAKACTHENPKLRPSMRSIVVALMSISSSSADWNIGAFYENISSTYESRTTNIESYVVAKGDLWRIVASHGSSTLGSANSSLSNLVQYFLYV